MCDFPVGWRDKDRGIVHFPTHHLERSLDIDLQYHDPPFPDFLLDPRFPRPVKIPVDLRPFQESAFGNQLTEFLFAHVRVMLTDRFVYLPLVLR